MCNDSRGGKLPFFLEKIYLILFDGYETFRAI